MGDRLDPAVLLERNAVELRDSVHRLYIQFPGLAWPEALQQFTVIQGRCAALLRQAHSAQARLPIHRQAVVVARISTQPDEHLATATDGRVLTFDGTVAPEVLRSKHTPDIELLHAGWAALLSADPLMDEAEATLARLHESNSQFAAALQRDWHEAATTLALQSAARAAPPPARAGQCTAHLAALHAVLHAGPRAP